jgi:hypothetical protein
MACPPPPPRDMAFDGALGGLSVLAFTWGTTGEERGRHFPCDRHVDRPDAAYFRGVDVDAPPVVVFRWLCQLKVAPYSYDWIDNLGRLSPRQLTPGLDRLAVGQRFMTGFELIDFEAGRHLTLVARRSFAGSMGLDALAVSYVVLPRAPAGARLVAKLVVRYRPGPGGWLARQLLPWGDLVMMRKQLLTLRHLAETQHARGGFVDTASRIPCDHPVPPSA